MALILTFDVNSLKLSRMLLCMMQHSNIPIYIHKGEYEYEKSNQKGVSTRKDRNNKKLRMH
jgi:hypothetical protein